ncbi:putative MFS transporter superfamily [Helianthus anomalus]
MCIWTGIAVVYVCGGVRTAWLGIYYMCIPTGISAGYVYGGVVGGSVGWRYAFFGEAILMLPFAMLGFTIFHLLEIINSGIYWRFF